MSGTLTTLGTILPMLQPRDAIHIAVISVVAWETLRPGQHVGIKGVDAVAPDLAGVPHAVAIVDPFLRRPVLKGQVFWAYLYPNTITALRHDWTHPVIDHD